MIESSTNKQIKHILKCKKSAKYRHTMNTFIVEGWKMVEEALVAELVEHIYVSEQAYPEFLGRWTAPTCPIDVVERKLFLELSDTTSPQGVLAMVAMPQYDFSYYSSLEKASFLCLENINDPGNLGTMMRTAEGAGMTGVILSKETVDLFNPKVVRATMGSLFRVPFFVASDFVEVLEQLKLANYDLYAAHLQGSCAYDKVNYEGSLGILIGNEANGLTEKVAALSNKKIKIPMMGQLESLNAAVSAGILMYEVLRKRGE